MPVLNFGQPTDGIIQTAFIVPDIRAAMTLYTEKLRIGPWFLFQHFQLDDLHYRGEPAQLDITLALGCNGYMMYELIQQNCRNPSVYRDIYDKRGWGFHHYGVSSPDFEADCKRLKDHGYTQALYGVVGLGTRAAYYDCDDDLGGMIELIEMAPSVEALWTMVHQASVGWNGSEPVRNMDGLTA